MGEQHRYSLHASFSEVPDGTPCAVCGEPYKRTYPPKPDVCPGRDCWKVER